MKDLGIEQKNANSPVKEGTLYKMELETECTDL